MLEEVNLTGLLARTSLLYKKKLNALMEARGINLSSEMCGTLVELWKCDSRSQQELADSLQKDKGGMTKIVKSLEKRELIKRTRDPEDGRQKKIELTTAGSALESRVEPLLNDLRQSGIKGIPAENLAVFRESLLCMMTNLNAF